MRELVTRDKKRRVTLVLVGALFFASAALVHLVGTRSFENDTTIESYSESASDQKVLGTQNDAEAQEGEVKGVVSPEEADSLVFRIKTVFSDTVSLAEALVLGALDVEGSANILGALGVGGDASIGGDVTVDGNLVVQGGEIEATNVVYSITAQDGLQLTGVQEIVLQNTDLGSAQNIFKNFKIGSNTLSAESNDDTLTWEAGTGVTLSNSGKTITVAADSAALNVSGWNKSGSSVVLGTISDNVGIGTATPEYKLHVVGNSYFSGSATFAGGTVISSGINNSSGGITNAGPITGATGLTSSGTITLSSLSTGVLQSNVNGVLSSSALNLAGGASLITGALPVSNGGTGITSVNSGDILYASGSNVLAALGAGAEGEVLTISSGIPAWGSSGSSGPCATCLVDNPGSTQTIIPTAATATGLSVRQASGGTADVFEVSSFDGTTSYFRVDSSGNVLLGSGVTSAMGNLSIAPAGTDPIIIAPTVEGAGQFSGTITSSDLTANRTWTFPNESGVVCLATGNCSGTSAGIGGSGASGYLTKWTDTYSVGQSVLYDNGTNIGVGTATPGTKLAVNGTFSVSGLSSLADAYVSSHATVSGELRVDQAVDFNSTFGVNGATTLGSTLDVTGLATFGGNVGIGTTTPLSSLHTKGDIRIPHANRIYLRDDGDTAWIRAWGATLQFQTNNAIRASLDGNGVFRVPSNGAFAFSNTSTDSTATLDTGLSRLSANTLGVGNGTVGDYSGTLIAGNVGIGTTAPVADLDIQAPSGNSANVILNGATGSHSYYQFQEGGTNLWMLGHFGTDDEFRISNGNGLWSANSNQQLVIESAGEIGMFTVNPDEILEINIGAATGGIRLSYNDNDGSAITYADLLLNSSGHLNLAPTGNVGIRVDAPAEALEVGGNIGLGAYPEGRLTHNGDPDTYYEFGNNKARVQAGGTPGWEIDSSLFRGNWANQTNMDFSWDGDFNDGVLFVDTSTETVGIGTTTPISKLHVQGATVGKALVTLNETGDQNILTASASGVTRLVVDTNGNIGIGSSAPAAKIDVNAPTGFSGYLFDYKVDGTHVGRLTSDGIFVLGNGGDCNAFCLTESSLDTGWNFTINPHNGGHLLLMPDGNVGIGTTSPVANAHIYQASPTANQILFQIGTDASANRFTVDEDGDGHFGGDVDMRNVYVGNGTFTGPSFSFINDPNTGIYRPGVDTLGFVTGAAENMTLNADGNVGIGSTSPGIELDVVGSARFSGVGSGAFSSDLNITADGTLTTSTSDMRLKENFVALEDRDVLAKILQLQTYTFNWKDGGSSDLGMIAQEVAQILPELTFTNKTDGYMGINYSRLSPLLVNAVQEQQRQLALLALRIDAQGTVVSQQGAVLGHTTESTQSGELAQWSSYLSLGDGVWQFLTKVVFAAQAEFNENVLFMRQVVFKDTVRFEGKTLGAFVVPAGATKVAVTFEKPFSEAPTVFLSGKNLIVGGYSAVSTTKDGFIFELEQAQQGDVTMQWFAVVGDGGAHGETTILESSTATPNTEVVPSPESTPQQSPSPIPQDIDVTEESDATSSSTLEETPPPSTQSAEVQ